MIKIKRKPKKEDILRKFLRNLPLQDLENILNSKEPPKKVLR
jgi:hypothetical protein